MLEPGWLEMARAFGGTEGQIWSKVVMRGASPAILEGWRLGLIRAVTGMVATELLLVAVGIGRLLIDYQSRFEAGQLCATVVLIVAEAVLLARLGERAAAWLFPWAGRTVLE
jgi:ABC-type nitrate/sulfonate/bicarbonate transport system permease component